MYYPKVFIDNKVFLNNINYQLARDNDYVKLFYKIQPKKGGQCPRPAHVAMSLPPQTPQRKILILTFVHNLHLAKNRRTLIILRREEFGIEDSRLAAGFFIDYF
jgi:hypothetical protein